MTRADQLAATVADILALQNECGEPNWDGYRALLVTTESIARAILLVNALPDDISMPVVVGVTDGEISLIWVFSQHRSMAVSVGKTDRLNYAYLHGNNSEHGTVGFDGQTVPEVIASGIRRVIG